MKAKTLIKVAMALVLCPLAMFMLTLVLGKRYTARMLLLADTAPRVATPTDPLSADLNQILNPNTGQTVATQLDVLTGTTVLLDAVQRTAQKYPQAFPDSQSYADKYQSLLNRLKLDNNKDSNIVSVAVTMDNPDLAAEMANNIGYAYIDMTKHIGSEADNNVMELLRQRIPILRNQLAQKDKEIADLKKNMDVSDLATGVQMNERNASDLEEQRARASSQLQGAIAQLGQEEANLKGLAKFEQSQTGTTRNPQIDQLDLQIAAAQSELAQKLRKYTPESNYVKDVKSKLDQLKKDRAALANTVEASSVKTLNPNYITQQNAVNAARSSVQSLQNQVSDLDRSIAAIKSKQPVYPIFEERLSKLTRERANLELTYQQHVQRLSTMETTNAGGQSTARIMSTALPPSDASFPNVKMFVIMGLAVGVVISALILMPKAQEDPFRPLSDAPALDQGYAVDELPAASREPNPAIGPGKNT